MAQEIAETDKGIATLFNSRLETGVRAAVLLDAVFPRSFDLLRLTWLDHLVVHTADIGGPQSLHPNIPQRTGELLVRRHLVEEGLNMMRKLHLVDAAASGEGVTYQAREEASAFVDSLRTVYGRKLKDRAVWLANYLQESTDADIATLIDDRIGLWTVEFQGQEGARGDMQ